MAIAPSPLKMPLDAATQKFAFLGRTGTGKSYAASKLAEELLLNKAQIVALDPVGIWYGLRIGADGRSPGFTIPVFGGLHGDVPLESTAGELIADLVIDRGISAVIDVSQFESDAQKCRFAADFASRLFFRKKSDPGAIMVFLEEAQEFIPQNPEKNETTMLHAFSRLCKIGRNFGIGAAVISQRPQEINKKVLNMTECMFTFQMTGPQERETIRKWVQDKGADLDIVNDLPRFEVGQCHVWSQQWLKVSKTIRIAPKQTLNASSTPQIGSARRIEPTPLNPNDLERLRAAMADSIERAERDDPTTLRKRIAHLEGELRARAITPEQRAEIENRIRQQYEGEIRALRTAIQRGREILLAAGGEAETQLPPAMMAVAQDPAKLRAFNEMSGDDLLAMRKRNEGERNGTPSTLRLSQYDSLGKGEHTIMCAIAQYGSITNSHIAILTGYKPTSRRVFLQRLKQRGYIEDNGGAITPTQTGLSALGDYEQLPTGSALRAYWLSHLPEGERRIFAALCGSATETPRAFSRQELQDITGYKATSVRVYCQRLGARKLIGEADKGTLKASEELFV